jgi:hypothetical protein
MEDNYLQQMLSEFQNKAEGASYAERRAELLMREDSSMEIETEL